MMLMLRSVTIRHGINLIINVVLQLTLLQRMELYGCS